MNKISTKLALYFTIAVLVMEGLLMLYLYDNIIDTRIEEEFQSILSRGNSHRDVLEDRYSETTLHHIALMESKTETEVVITDQNHNVITGSRELTDGMRELIQVPPESLTREGRVIESNWKDMNYLATVTSFESERNEGYVYMFKSAAPLRNLISQLNRHFLLAGILSLIILTGIHFLLSKLLTRPLLKMKQATEKLSKGNFEVKLPELGQDELGDLSDSIQRLATDLETIQQERTEFLANISHELRTPLTYIQGYANVALREDIPESERKEYLNIIQEESKTILTLIENLFELAKIDENNFSIQTETIDSGSFYHKVINKVAPVFKRKGIDLILTVKEDFPFLADPIRLEQIVMNLLDNALKHSPPHSTTEVTVERNDSGNMSLLIHDQGMGIPPEELPQVFNRMYRVEKSRSREFGGSGLGLSIVKELVEAHGGQISIQSERNKGTSINIIL
ncbi:cell wall metabolism sensor histidine kinase WalK [Rossellomorea aquimaris]|uniref:histidine kinase n=1 Tax=Rossellomorea aquimaris TaxID=189382 RepID=A0A366EN93_9BACI|nr:HAMP domain-containing sensor histidine kinase [Rossellomorea aquimaris]RBP02935.1 HAMP domain-containing protein [Rossellomorea aquimaris]